MSRLVRKLRGNKSASPGAAPQFSLQQEADQFRLLFTVLDEHGSPSVSNSEVRVEFAERSVRLGWPGQHAFQLNLWGSVDAANCWWSLDSRTGALEVFLLKAKPGEQWPALLHQTQKAASALLRHKKGAPEASPERREGTAGESERREGEAQNEEESDHPIDLYGDAVSVWNALLAWGYRMLQASPRVHRLWFSHLIVFIFGVAALSLLQMVLGVAGGARSFSVAMWLYQKCFGLIWLAVWMSVGVQLLGLIGEKGIVPVTKTMQDSAASYWEVPTLFTVVRATDRNLMRHVWLGLLCSALFTLNVLPALSMLVVVVLYLSIRQVGSVFWALQFDLLLVEAGFLAVLMFLTPFHFLRYTFFESYTSYGALVAVWLHYWLNFRLLFSSGFVKLMSGDVNWRSCNALLYHYWTQPLPTWIGYWVHNSLQARMHQAACFVHFIFELVMPCFFFVPQLRFFAFLSSVALQAGIILTGNYGHFNFLSIVIALPLLDDSWVAAPLHSWITTPVSASHVALVLPQTVLAVALTGVVLLFAAALFLGSLVPLVSLGRNSFELAPAVKHFVWGAKVDLSFLLPKLPEGASPSAARAALLDYLRSVSVAETYRRLSSFNVLTSYGLFAIMTTTRNEILIYGSDDLKEWKAYELPFKPGENLSRAPAVLPFCHLPRLDWRLWFCGFRYQKWTESLAYCLLKNEKEVRRLFRVVPFAVDAPPKYLKMMKSSYEFTTVEESRMTGNYWKRGPLTMYGHHIFTLDAKSDRLQLIAAEGSKPRGLFRK